MDKSQREHLENSISLQPQVRLLSIKRKAGELEGLSRHKELGPFKWTSDKLLLELNGTVVGYGKLEIHDNGAVFTISEIYQEVAE